MFGAVKKIAGCARVYPVTDAVLANGVLDIVHATDVHTCVSHTLQWRDVPRLQECMVAINPIGRQIHLVLTTLGDRAATYLVHTYSRCVELVPLRFARHLHEGDTVMHATLIVGEHTIVVNRVVGDIAGKSALDRVRAVHDIVHDHHTPDAALFPLRLVARRSFALDQGSEMKRYMDRVARVHSISILRAGHANKDYRIVLSQTNRAGGACDPKSRPPPAMGSVARASIIAMQAPDAYKVVLNGSQSWDFLVVRTLEESAALGELDLTAERPCQVRWDGSGWRMVALI